MIEKIIILVNKRPSSDENIFIKEILSTMKVKGKIYKEQISEKTIIKICEVGDLNFENQGEVVGVLLVKYLQMFNSPPPVQRMTLAPFESSVGVNGNVIAEF